MEEYCPNCGEQTEPGATFCSYCGEQLTDDQPTQHGGGKQHDDGWGTEQGRQRETGQAAGGRRQQQHQPIPRRGALDTFSQGFSWLLSEPSLIGLFVAGALVSSVVQIVAPSLSILNIFVNSLIGAVAFIATERKVQNSQFDISAAVQQAIDRIVSLVVIAFVYGVAVIVGIIMLVVPGIYLGCRLALALPACILDGQGVSESLSTSWEVADGNLQKIFGMFLLYFGIVFAFTAFAVGTGGQSTVENPAFVLVSSVAGAVVGGAYNLAIGRVYLENRHQQAQQPR